MKVLHTGIQMLMRHKKFAMESLDLHRKLSYFNPRFFLVVFDFMKEAHLRYFVEYQHAKTLICIQPIYTHTHTHALEMGELLFERQIGRAKGYTTRI